MKKKKMLAMLLAGGQGSRLYDLTTSIAKPAVSFGGKYRIIDFGLSNCVNSGIDTVGILVQYKPLVLNRYVGTGESWDMAVADGGVHILPPYAGETGGEWYEGTADAIYHNIDFIDMYNPENVLILSGDHIYKMDYDKMLEYHKEQGATATIAVMPVTLEEATRFGIMITDDENKIIDFEEKPAHPRSTLASMGIYIFDWKKLRALLIKDKDDPDSDHDFGNNIIPALLNGGEKLVAYKFEGYWKDVGTIDSLWEANMDLLDENNDLNLNDPKWRIYTEDAAALPAYIGPDATVDNAYITQGCSVCGLAKNSVIFTGAKIGEGAKVIDSVLMPGVTVEPGAVVTRALVADNVTISKDAVVGEADSKNILLVAQDV